MALLTHLNLKISICLVCFKNKCFFENKIFQKSKMVFAKNRLFNYLVCGFILIGFLFNSLSALNIRDSLLNSDQQKFISNPLRDLN